MGSFNEGFQVVGNMHNTGKNGNVNSGSKASLSVGSKLQYRPKVNTTTSKTPSTSNVGKDTSNDNISKGCLRKCFVIQECGQYVE